ncbi:MAG: hypothetical protein ACM3PY_15165, partial [Omnitrophica WOR_2 bacterium]
SEDVGQLIYEYNWRLGDLINPLLESGLQLRRLVESPANDPRFWLGPSYLPGGDEGLLNWSDNPRAGLLECLSLTAKKP